LTSRSTRFRYSTRPSRLVTWSWLLTFDSGSLGDYSAEISWGDGTAAAGEITAGPDGAGEVSGSHTYASTGSEIVGVTVFGDGYSAPGTIPVTVADASVLFLNTSTANAPSSAWSFVGGTWQTNGGTLSQTSTAAADPKKAMITNQTYPSNLMITSEVQVNSWNPGDFARAGVGLYTNTSNAYGYDLLFHGTNQVEFLDDHVAWGNSYTFDW
jgi:hypothetical protein